MTATIGPVEHRSSPVHALKVCSSLVWLPGAQLEVAPLWRRVRVPLTASARCVAPGAPHREPVPAVGCSCGFWGCASLRSVRAAIGRPLRRYDVVLVVEFSGRVVEHELGWRAERQDVMGVGFQRRCARCGARRGVGLQHRRSGALDVRCARCVEEGSSPLELAALPVPARWLPSSVTRAKGPVERFAA